MRNYNFKVEALEAGQRRPYGDSYYSYIVEDVSEHELTEMEVKAFCTAVVKPAKYSQAEWLKLTQKYNPDVHFSNYYSVFEKIGERKYKYVVVSSYTG